MQEMEGHESDDDEDMHEDDDDDDDEDEEGLDDDDDDLDGVDLPTVQVCCGFKRLTVHACNLQNLQTSTLRIAWIHIHIVTVLVCV